MSSISRLLALGLMLAIVCLPLAAQTYTLQRFQAYGPKVNTYASGINNRGAIVGNCDFGGFKRDANGVFEPPIADPNAGSNGLTVVKGINDSGVIAGYYSSPTQSNFPGFLLYQGVFTDYYVQPGKNTLIFGINNKGDLVGNATGLDGNLHGFVSRNGVVSQVDFPGGARTKPYGIAADGTIVGSFHEHRVIQGFLRGPAGHYQALNIPGAIQTVAYGINNVAHKIVGVYTTSGHAHGFVYDYITGVITTIDWPNPTTYYTAVTGVNSHGVIVGWSWTYDSHHNQSPVFSFIGTPQ